MLNQVHIQIPWQVVSTISQTLPILRTRCEQFASTIFQRVAPDQFDLTLALVEKALMDFAEQISRNCLQAMVASVLNNLQTLKPNQCSQGIGEMKQRAIDEIGMLELYSEQSNLWEPLISQFNHIKQEEEIQSINKYIGTHFAQEEILKQVRFLEFQVRQIFQEAIKCFNENENEKKVMNEFIQDFEQDLKEPLKQNQIQSLQIGIKQQLPIDKRDLYKIIYGQIDSELLNPYEEKARNKRKKIQQQNNIKFNMNKEQRLELLKSLHCQRILKMKQKFIKIKNKLFQHQLQKFWFFKLDDKKIQIKLMNCNKYQLNKLKKIFREWRKELQVKSLDTDKCCIKHKSQIYYLCLNQTLKEKVYLCNQCIQSKEETFSHQNHELICQRHRRQIKYKLIPQQKISPQEISQNEQQQEQEIQLFKCQQCLKRHTQKYAFVSCCHYQAIVQLCIQQKCIQIDDFMVCPTCIMLGAKHQHHRRIDFNKQTLMNQFRLQNQVDITQFQQQFIYLQERLQLRPLQKIKNSYAEKIWPTIRFLQSFAVHSNIDVKKWIDCVMSEGKKEDLIVLRGVLELKQRNYNEANRRNYLQIFNDLMEKELQGMFTHIWEGLQPFCQRIGEIRIIEDKQRNDILNKKYEQFLEIETNDKVTLSPMRLQEVSPIHYMRIQKIIVIKERQENQKQIIEKEWRDKRSTFYKHQIKYKLQQNEVEQKYQLQIIELFKNAEQNSDDYQLSINLDELGQLSQYRQIIKKLKQYFKSMNQQFQRKKRECLPFVLIKQQNLANLKVIHIEYQLRGEYNYSISAFELFKVVHINQQLEQVTLKGVFVKQIRAFMKLINPNNDKQDTNKQNLDLAWMETFRPSQSLRLTINTQIYFHMNNKDQTLSRINDWEFFLGLFGWLSDIAVWTKLGKQSEIVDWGKDLQYLLMSLRAIKNIKIEICGEYKDEIGKPQVALFGSVLFGKLTSFTEILHLTLRQISFSSQLSVGDFLGLEQSLSTLFENNTVAHLGLHECYNFPVCAVTTLQQINLHYVSFRSGFGSVNELLRNNKSLKSIECKQIKQEWSIDDKLFNQLQSLVVSVCNSMSFIDLQSTSPSSLKYLTIQDDRLSQRISVGCLQRIFPKLINLTHLRLWDINQWHQLPSQHLKELEIWQNNAITDLDLQMIDSKSPQLRKITLRSCRKVTERFLSVCKFKNLMEISIGDNSSKQLSSQAKHYLKSRGIQCLFEYI